MAYAASIVTGSITGAGIKCLIVANIFNKFLKSRGAALSFQKN